MQGFAELEYGILRWMGAIDEHTLVATTVHDCQVLVARRKFLLDGWGAWLGHFIYHSLRCTYLGSKFVIFNATYGSRHKAVDL
jgi:hypothetical protein